MPKKVTKKSPIFKPFTGGLTMCYVGNGKGKTTAAVGAAVRARGYGFRVAFLQFFKSEAWPSGERVSLKKLGVVVKVYGKGFVGILGDRLPKKEHSQAALSALREAAKIIMRGTFDVIVLDEIISCVEVGLLSQSQVLRVLRKRKKTANGRKPHLVLTGHVKYPTITSQCDVVTDMRMVSHPYYKGYLAVKGIDF